MTSNTGLLASKTKKVSLNKKKKSIHLAAIAVPAPMVLRPFADLYNPFSYGCSLLCNHPVDREAKDILKKARETWAQENKNIILPEEVQAIRDSLAIIDDHKQQVNIDKVPEELFRRYTDTDSRPLTPAPTLASVKTRGSGSRRCVTPDPITTSVLQERKLLILDLRRSHSQEIISWTGTNCDVPVISILQPPTPSMSIDTPSELPDIPSRKETPRLLKSASPKSSPKKIQKQLEVPKSGDTKKILEHPKLIEPASEASDVEEEEEEFRRKGKIRRRKKRGRDSSRGPLAVESSADPETMVSSAGQDAEGKQLVKTNSIPEQNDTLQNAQLNNNQQPPDSFLEPKFLKHLQRELTYETVDLEFNETRRIALEEAFKTLPTEPKPVCKEMKQIQKELNVPPINAELWLSLPRVFSRSSVRFGLPLHSRLLIGMTPLRYLREHVNVSNARQLLYNMVFKRHQNQELENDRVILKENLRVALGEMMGKELTDKQFNDFYDLVNWTVNDKIDFKTWCGMCGLFERIYAGEFCPHLRGKNVDPCDQVEIADFESLTRRLQDIKVEERLVKILYAIKDA